MPYAIVKPSSYWFSSIENEIVSIPSAVSIFIFRAPDKRFAWSFRGETRFGRRISCPPKSSGGCTMIDPCLLHAADCRRPAL
jgi:hypothetical protein